MKQENKLAIIDLDGVVAHSDARFALADQTANAEFDETIDPHAWRTLKWRTVFDPTHVPLDTLIEGADTTVARLEQDGYQVLYLTSRPESMREATQTWLLEHRCYGPPLLMKPPVYQYTPTVIWKVGTIQMMGTLFGAHKVLVVDDEVSLLRERLSSVILPFTLWCFTSLSSLAAHQQGAAREEEEENDDDLPF